MNYLENFFKGFICIHILVTMDPRHTDVEDEQFLLNLIGEGQGDVPEQADDGSNTDIYLNMSGDGIEPPSIQDDAAGEQSANVHITTILTCIKKLYFHLNLYKYYECFFIAVWIIVAAEKDEARPDKKT